MSMTAAQIRLPGIYFLPAQPNPGLGLPPLDVASFVGFAERGPLDTPVPVEDLATYRDVFGGPLAVARESGGETVYAYLPDAVASFFANGGRRCYVVRVAGPQAKTARFELPGLVSLGRLQAGMPLSPRRGTVLASSAGEWADRLGVGLRLRSAPLPAAKFQIGGGLNLRWEAGGAPEAVRPGDLLRLSFRNGGRWLLPVSTIAPPSGAETRFTVMAESAWRLIGLRELGAARTIVEARLLTSTGTELLSGLEGGLAPMTSPQAGDKLTLELRGEAVRRLRPGDALRIVLNDGAVYLFPLTSLRPSRAIASPALPQTSAVADEMLREDGSGWTISSTISSPPAPDFIKVERLRFDLLLRYGKQSRPTLDELSFNAPHPRFWGDAALLESSLIERRSSGLDRSAPLQGRLPETGSTTLSPVDLLEPAVARAARLFREMRRDGRGAALSDILPETAALAGLLAPLGEEERLETFLPLGMPSVVAEEDIVGLETKGDDDLVEFRADLFLDPHLRQQTSGGGLLNEAIDRRYTQGRRLLGLHSLLFVEEVAMVAIPDAVHREWRPERAELPQVIVSPPAPPAQDLSRFNECEPSDHPTPSPSPAVPETTAAEGRRLPVLIEATDRAIETEPSLTLHQALVIFCQARRDAVGILTLPRHFDKRHCVAWSGALRVKLGLPPRRVSTDEARDRADLSYVAVYHPWLFISDANAPGRARAMPCDGAVCGMIAARERARQVWVAPANQPLNNVLGLTPTLTTEDWAELFDLQFNLTRPEALDFRVMSAHTLSDERAWLQLSVRRLLIQLRKAALARGMDYVFENNSPQFQEGVRVTMESLLRFMFQRGAFSGASEAQAFRVTTDAGVNSRDSVERGRFIAQIQVAPSQPMEFITVLLTRVGEDQLLAAEI
jgi:hypothetical protein